MPERMLHIASAVVKARRSAQDAVAAAIAALDGAEVLVADHGRIIVVLESDHHGALGETLNRIADVEGVLSATLVFEHSEPEGETA
jgi:nitrate reductase NapD